MLQAQKFGQKSALSIEEKFKSLSEEDFANLYCVVARIMRNYKYSGRDIADKPTFKVDNLTISNCEWMTLMELKCR